MIKDFSQTVVLTSQNPEAFINFRWESGDASAYVDAQSISSINDNILFVNGLDISQEASIYGDPSTTRLFLGDTGDPSIASFHIYTRELSDFDTTLSIIYDSSSLTETVDISILNRPYIIKESEVNVYETSEVQIDGETSYLILRTNPKFTGNIKLSVDTSNNIYLDTFKISDILNNKKYRKQKVSGESVLSGDIRRIFSDMPLGELYRLDAEDTLNIAIPKTNLYQQYNLNYSYGARLFLDELYDDDYSLLAPIWINSQLPDYFAIFRVSGVYNSETYPDPGDTEDLSELATKYLEEGELIRSWGMKNETPIGTYLRNHLEELLTVRSPLFLSLSDPTQKDPDPNSWYGIAVDKGIITGRSETPYFFDQKETTTDINAFLSEGYERQNLLCPNLINMEFIFSDHDVSLYTMNRYFGLYLTENELYEISYYAQNPDSSISVLSLDGKDSSVFFNSSIFDSSGNILSNFKNRIFTLNDIQTIKRISNVDEINGNNKEYVEEWLNKPGDNLFSTNVIEKFTNKFFTFNLEKALTQGEHLRIIDKTDFKIWEVYGLESDLLDEGSWWTYASYSTEDGYPEIYRTVFSIKGNISDQINAIKGAFDVFQDYLNTPFETTIIKENEGQLSFKIKDWANNHNFWFQRITAQTTDYVYDTSSGLYDPSSNFNNAADYGDIKFYGVLEPSINDFERLKYDSSYGPIDFELYGDRMSIMINFLDSSINYFYSFDSSLVDLFTDYTMYMGTDEWYRIVNTFDITTSINHSYDSIVDPHEEADKNIISTSNKIFTINGKWNAYSTYPLIISLMGINPVKDFDFTVYDSSYGFESEYRYDRSDDENTYKFTISENGSLYITNRNAYEIISGSGRIEIGTESSIFSATSVNPFYFNTFESSAYIINNSISDIVVTYNQIDGSFNYTSYDASMSEENLGDYYINREELRYGLTVPYVTKWVGLGFDCRNNPFRLLLDGSLFEDTSTNFIPFENNFKGEISYPSFKYLDRGTRAWESYIYFDINDSIEYTSDGSTLYTTPKDLMLNESTIDVFSKFMYSNHNINETKLRSSIVYYNDYKESIDALLNGLNISMVIDDNAKNTFDIQDWDRFRISFVSTASRNRNNNFPIEVFINENTSTILIVWYQGSDVLNYNKRYSSYFGGRNTLDGSIGPVEFRSFRTGDRFWSFIKSPFVVNNASLSSDFVNIYGILNNYDTSICSPYGQLNWNFGDSIYSVFNAYADNFALSNSFQFDVQYNTFRQYVDYNYIKYSSTYGTNILNYGYTYLNNANIYQNNTCELSTLKSLFTSNNIGYYIFRGNNIYRNTAFSVPPIIMSINDPRSYKGLYTYNGWYRPKFNNILDFNFNEDLEIINIVEKDFTFSNTNFKEYNNIPQYWYNKVVSEVTTNDVSLANAINYLDNFNVFKAQWDGDYYTLSSDSGNSLVDGFNSTLELPSYFGSKLVKLPTSLELNSWDSVTSDSTDDRTSYVLEYNLTRKIVNMFKDNITFTDNWGPLTTTDNIIDGYIKETILGYYNISKSKINVELWTKNYDGTRLAYKLDSTFKQDTAINIDAKLVFENNEYLYKIRVPSLPNLTYFVKFTLFEK